jgi:PTH1 family peptidyl-tRNA hydrolase
VVRALVALGNPGPEYAGHRHNVGFWLADGLARAAGETFGEQRRFKSSLAQITLADQPLWLLKPSTFMNRSGEAVQPFTAFYKLTPADLLLVHDDLDLPPGTVRLKRGGGHGGHNGLRDVTRAIGPDFARLRIGIGHPGDKSRVLGYVLAAPTREQADALAAGLARAVTGLELLLREGWGKATQYLHTEPETRNTKHETGP